MRSINSPVPHARLVREAPPHGLHLDAGKRYRCARDVTETAHHFFKGEDREMVLILALDSKHRALCWHLLSIGSYTCSMVHPTPLFRLLIAAGAGSFLFIHNHPSGDPTPSAEDFEITKRLKDAGEMVGIALLDSIIVAGPDDGFVSFREGKLIDW